MADDVKIKINLGQVKNLAEEFRKEVIVRGLYDVAEAGEKFLRQEVPKVTHNLEQGVSSEVDENRLTAELLVAARAGRVGVEGGTLHLPSGATREISLRAQPAYDYARAVAKGTGVYATDGAFGPQQVIRPVSARALLIPVGSVPVAVNGKPQAYVTSNGKIYVFRKYSRGRRPDPYDVRAAQRLEPAVPAIFDRVVNQFAAGRGR
jgi:hypothetical protein